MLLRRACSELDQLFFGKMLTQLGIELIGHIRRRIGHRVRHAEQSGLRWREAFKAPAVDGGDLVVGTPVHSAAGRIGVDSERASDAHRRPQYHQRPQALGTFALWPSSHSVSAYAQKTRGTRAAIFCGIRSRPSIFRTFLNT